MTVITMRRLLFLLLSIFLVVKAANAQSCNPASVDYLVRDEKGQLLNRDQLNSVLAELPKLIGDATVSDGDVSFTADKVTYYWPEDADWEKGTKVPALLFSNAGTCTMKLGEVTLTLNGKKMRLAFNIDINRTQDDRRQVVDSVRFQQGSFRLDLTGWDRAREKLIPAKHWKPAQ